MSPSTPLGLSTLTGWLTVATVVLASAVPLGYRLRHKRRAAPDSKPIRSHVALGLAAAAFAGFHTLAVLPSLGSAAAVGGGMAAIGPAFVALFVLVAHVGIGLRLRNVKLKDRPRQRARHVFTATAIAMAVTAHVTAILLAGQAN